jgi:hypothetical protein
MQLGIRWGIISMPSLLDSSICTISGARLFNLGSISELLRTSQKYVITITFSVILMKAGPARIGK